MKIGPVGVEFFCTNRQTWRS